MKIVPRSYSIPAKLALLSPIYRGRYEVPEGLSEAHNWKVAALGLKDVLGFHDPIFLSLLQLGSKINMVGSWRIGEHQEKGNDKGDSQISGLGNWVTHGPVFLDGGTGGEESTFLFL